MKVVLATMDNWAGLYVGEKLVDQGHSLRVNRVLNAVKDVGPFEFEEVFIDYKCMETNRGYLPDDIKDLLTLTEEECYSQEL